jgi:hypothetical protein
LPRLREEIQRRAAALLPPKTVAAAKAFASAGPFVLDLLAASRPNGPREVCATIRSAVEIGGDEAMSLLSRYGDESRESIQRELLAGWSRFGPERYACKVLANLPVAAIKVDDLSLIAGCRHLSKVKEIECHASGKLDYFPPQLERLILRVQTTPDLASLSAKRLKSLYIGTFPSRLSPPKIDVSHLRGQESLGRLCIVGGESEWIGRPP